MLEVYSEEAVQQILSTYENTHGNEAGTVGDGWGVEQKWKS